MSVRAYRVKRIEHEQSDSFNLWHDEGLVKFLEEKGCLSQLNDDLGGLIEIPIDVLKEALQKVNMSEETRISISKDIEICQDAGYVTYYCF